MPEKILICSPAWLGDMMMSQALFIHLFQQGHELHVLAPEWNFAVLERMPEVKKCIPLPLTHAEFKLRERYRIGKALRAEYYDRAIILQNSWKSALIPYFANIPRRTGWKGECRYGLINDMRHLNKAELPLMVQRYVNLAYGKNKPWNVSSFPYPALKVDQDIRQKILDKYGLSLSKPILALSPGAAFGETKQWPAEYYADIAQEKINQGWQVWLFGTAKDKLATDAIMHYTDDQCINLAGLLPLDETVDLMSAAKVFVGNDSGLLHVAAALKVPVIGIYGSTTADFTPPLSQQSQILFVKNLSCRPCFQRTCRFKHLRCLWDIKPEKVSAVLQALLA